MVKTQMLVLAGCLLFAPSALSLAQELPPAAVPQVQVPPRTHHLRRHRHRVIGLQGQPPAPIGTPAPQEAGTAGTSPAPVPNEDIGPPRTPTATDPSVDPGNLSIHYPPLGNGYLPGSSPQDVANTQTPKVPGVTVKVPLEQARPEILPPPEAH